MSNHFYLKINILAYLTHRQIADRDWQDKHVRQAVDALGLPVDTYRFRVVSEEFGVALHFPPEEDQEFPCSEVCSENPAKASPSLEESSASPSGSLREP